MSCPDGVQHNTKQHQHVDGQIDDAADWGRDVKVKAESESNGNGVLRCKCGAFMSCNHACKRCEKLRQGFRFQAMGFDATTAQRFTDAIAKAPDKLSTTGKTGARFVSASG